MREQIRDEAGTDGRLLGAFSDSASDAMFAVLLADGCIHDVNNAACRFLGQQREQLLKQSIVDHLPDGEWGRIGGIVKDAYDESGESSEMMLSTTLNKMPVELSLGQPFGVEEPLVLLIARRIITDKEQRQESRLEFLESILDSTSPVSIICTDLESNIRYWNSGAERLFGYTAAEVVGKAKSGILYPDDNSVAIADHVRKELFGQKRTASCQIREVAKDGKELWMQLYLTPRFSPDGEVVGILGIGQNITEQRRSSDKLAETNRLLRGILESSSAVSIISTDLDREILYWNSGAENLLGYSADEMIGKQKIDLLYADESSKHLTDEARNMLFTEKIPITTEVQERTKDGRVIWISMTLSPTVDADGNVTGILGLGRDITQERNTQIALQESEEQFRGIVENSPVGIYRMTPEGEVVLVNPTLAAMLGYRSDKELLDSIENTGDLRFWHSSPVHRKTMEQDGQVLGIEGLWRRRDRVVIHVRESARAVKDADGKVRFYEGTIEDVTERIRTEEERMRLHTAVEQMGEIVVVTDIDGTIQYVNPAFEKITGYKRSEAVGRNPRILKSEAHDRDFYRSMWGALAAEGVWEGAVTNRTKDGVLYEEEVTISAVRDSTGSIVNYVKVGRDITERKRAQEEIARVAAELRQLIDTANAPIFGVNDIGYINEWNHEAERLTGYRKDEVEGLDLVDELVDGDLRQDFRDVLQNALQGEETRNYELKLNTRDEGTVILLTNVTFRREATGNVFGVIAFGQDITELSEYRRSLEIRVTERTRELAESLKRERKLSEDLQVALEKEKELSQLKSRFVSMASHEFRTPLSTILTYTDLLNRYRDRMTPDQQSERLTKIRQQVITMTDLLEDVLVVGKSDAGRLDFAPDPLDIVEFCSGIVEDTRQVNESRQEIIFDVAVPDSKKVFSLDEKLMRHVVTNLLSNAIKYSPDEEPILFELSVADGVLKLRVTDHGIGIPEEDLPRLFEPFHRASNVGTAQGTGLGLSILQRSVDQHGGTVDVNSRVNEGTTFTVTIPLKE